MHRMHIHCARGMSLLLAEYHPQLQSVVFCGAATSRAIRGANLSNCLHLYGRPGAYNDLDPIFALILPILLQMSPHCEIELCGMFAARLLSFVVRGGRWECQAGPQSGVVGPKSCRLVKPKSEVDAETPYSQQNRVFRVRYLACEPQ